MKIKVKSESEIKDTLDINLGYEGAYWNEAMFRTCGEILSVTLIPSKASPYTFKHVDDAHKSWYYHEDWVEVVEEKKPSLNNPQIPKPPLGVVPKDIFEYQVNKNRTLELLRAIQDHVQEGKEHNEEWVTELVGRLLYLNGSYTK